MKSVSHWPLSRCAQLMREAWPSERGFSWLDNHEWLDLTNRQTNKLSMQYMFQLNYSHDYNAIKTVVKIVT